MLPLRATCTRMTSPQRPPFMALGRVGQPSTSRYGLGSSVGLGYEACCARAATLHVAMTMAMSVSARRFGRNIPVFPQGHGHLGDFRWVLSRIFVKQLFA